MATEPLAYADIKPLLARLAGTPSLVLIGGQALNFWADYYSSRNPLLRAEPFISNDIDFYGDKHVAQLCADRLGGHAKFPDMDHVTANSAIVSFKLDKLEGFLDFIDQPLGVPAAEVERLALKVCLTDEHGQSTDISFSVIHPVILMESRVANILTLPSKNSPGALPHSLQQLRASVPIAREFILDLAERGKTRDVLKLNERIFDFCTKRDDGRRIFAVHQVEPFDAVLTDPRLPDKFNSVRYPQMRELIARAREAAQAVLQRAQAVDAMARVRERQASEHSTDDHEPERD